MPYRVRKQGEKYVVYNKDTGKRVGATAGNKQALRKYLAALHINTNEEISLKAIAELFCTKIKSHQYNIHGR